MNIGLPTAVFVVFLALKLTGVSVVAGWSWWWVTSPLWISTGIGLLGFVLVAVVGAFSVRR